MELKKEVAAMINALSQIGSDPTGGMTRLLYTDSWKEAQSFVEKQLKETGLTTSYDAVGNLFGRMEGSQYPEETILSGSHIDTVVNGGTLDGQYGVVAAALAIKYLKETYGQPLHSLEVISMAEEEGSRFPTVFWGSKNFVGEAKKADVEAIADFKGNRFVAEMQRQGFDFRDPQEPVRSDIKAFVEIHIEQGSILEKENLQIGV
ncbi:hydantoinase/carbamoylase family amidase, partial [Listeria monocytogenes]|nr:hydantoinase/carbamoylase family amidase [Listeria monocytogenes]